MKSMQPNTVRFDEELFVDREKAREEFLHAVSAESFSPYLEFTAVAGQGKSELLKWIYHHARQYGYAAAYIDFEFARYHQAELYPVLETIARQLAEQIGQTLFSRFRRQLAEYLDSLYEQYSATFPSSPEKTPVVPAEMEQGVYAAFCHELNSILTWRPFVLCLDSTEKAYQPVFRDCEARLVLPYTTQRNFILITAGQEQVGWEQPGVKQRLRSYTLSNFDPKWTRKQIEVLAQVKNLRIEQGEDLIATMLRLTSGHPFSNYTLLDFLTDGFRSSVTSSVFEGCFQSAITMLLEHVVEARILERTRLGERYPSARTILWHLSPLRHIELSMFRYVLSTCLAEWFQEKPFTVFERLMGQFQKTSIFTRWQLGSGFNINPVVRNILLADLRENAPKQFLTITEMLEQAYDERVKKTHEATQVKYIVERLYHYANFLKFTQPNYMNALIHNELERYLDTYCTLEFTQDEVTLREQLNRLYSALAYDEEFGLLVDVQELLRMITERMEER